jgi:hypothetical protein
MLCIVYVLTAGLNIPSSKTDKSSVRVSIGKECGVWGSYVAEFTKQKIIWRIAKECGVWGSSVAEFTKQKRVVRE